jgi:acetyl-CoA acyltransferase
MDPYLKHWDMMNAMNAGLTAEKLFSQRNVNKEEMDRWAVRSHQLTTQAYQEGFFNGEILPIAAEQDDGTIRMVDRDQSIRSDTTLEAMAKLKPAYKNNGVITAGNSSPLNAGASGMILMAKEIAQKKRINPLATIRSIGFAGVDPTVMGIGPVPASKKALEKAGLQPKDIDYWEVNEAFCVVTLNFIKEFGIEENRVNVMGGATAIGHPLGATGIRLVGTLARILECKAGRWGCANACVGGGQGVATVVERESYNW